MYLTRHATAAGPRWAADGLYLPQAMTLGFLLSLSREQLVSVASETKGAQSADDPLLAPIESEQEVWAAGVTYLQSREARMSESDTADIYEKVYEADRVEVFYKSAGWRVRGDGQPIRVRADSQWNVPEPELTLVVNAAGAIVGYTAGNDVSSRDIEGENPLYLPQAKVYDGSCAVGPGIVIGVPDDFTDLPIRLGIHRGDQNVFSGETSTAQLKRGLDEIAGWVTSEMSFPYGVFVMTGTCLVPEDEFTLKPGDRVRIEVGDLAMDNPVES
jgi:2-dehydro-3-deoxy-D-arabinonate dehydratase